MKRTLFALLLCLAATTPVCAQVGRPAITQTIGTGNNTSYFVINFNDAPGSSNNPASDLVFAYDWKSGTTPSGEDILTALAQDTNPQFQVAQTYYATYKEHFVNGFTYKGHSQTGYYKSATDQASWVYWVNDTNTWQQDGNGADNRRLFNGSYDGWTFYVGDAFAGNPSAPIVPQATPEPSVLWIFAFGSVGLVLLLGRRAIRTK